MSRRWRVGLLATHPVQYYAPWYRSLAALVDLDVYFSHRQDAAGQAAAGYGVGFDWDVPLLDGYRSTFLHNRARRPDVGAFGGCDTPEIARLIRSQEFDAFIVHGWSTRSYWQAMLACWRTGTPLLVRGDSSLTTPRAWWWRALKRPLFRAFIPRFDGYLVVGREARDYYVHYGADPARCVASPHCVDNRFFAERAAAARRDRAEVRRSFGLPPQSTVFLFAGRFIERKQPHVFVEAVARAARDRANIAGLMVGDGPMHAETEAQAARAGTPVVLTGFLNQTEIVRAYAAADVLVVPSTWETWGLVVNEAMACGIPAVVTDGVACAGDLVEKGRTGEVVPVGDVDALTACIARLAEDTTYRQQLSDAALARVAHFDVSVAAGGAVRAVEQAVARRQAARSPRGSRSAAGKRERLT